MVYTHLSQIKEKCTLIRMLVWNNIVSCTGYMNHFIPCMFRGDMLLYAHLQEIIYIFSAPTALGINKGN